LWLPRLVFGLFASLLHTSHIAEENVLVIHHVLGSVLEVN
jgi:hypothetical protein